MPHFFRIRFLLPRGEFINVDAPSLDVPLLGSGAAANLTPLGTASIKDAQQLVLTGGPFEREEEAAQAGLTARHALVVTAARLRTGFDLGQDRATGGATKFLKDKVLAETGVRLLDDIHGLSPCHHCQSENRVPGLCYY